MGGFRLERVASLLRELLSECIVNLKDPRIGFVSITDVSVSQDMRHAKVYVSVYGDDESKAAAIEGLNNAKGFIRREIVPQLKMRCIPDLHFTLDESIENGVRMSALIDKAIEDDRRLREGHVDEIQQ